MIASRIGANLYFIFIIYILSFFIYTLYHNFIIFYFLLQNILESFKRMKNGFLSNSSTAQFYSNFIIIAQKVSDELLGKFLVISF